MHDGSIVAFYSRRPDELLCRARGEVHAFDVLPTLTLLIFCTIIQLIASHSVNIQNDSRGVKI